MDRMPFCSLLRRARSARLHRHASAVGLWLAMFALGASAQEVVQQPPALVDRDAANLFFPRLQLALTAELHFLKKVCEPSEAEFRAIHRAGREAIAAISREYSGLKRKRVKVGSWPDPGERIFRSLTFAVAQSMSAESAAKYQQAVNNRLQARRAADASAVVIMIDQQVMLDPQQQQELFDALVAGWQPHWSTAHVSLNHSNYAMFPEPEFLEPYLNDLQQRLWAARPRRRYASLMWQLKLGVYNLFPTKGLAEFPDPWAAENVEESN